MIEKEVSISERVQGYVDEIMYEREAMIDPSTFTSRVLYISLNSVFQLLGALFVGSGVVLQLMFLVSYTDAKNFSSLLKLQGLIEFLNKKEVKAIISRPDFMVRDNNGVLNHVTDAQLDDIKKDFWCAIKGDGIYKLFAYTLLCFFILSIIRCFNYDLDSKINVNKSL